MVNLKNLALGLVILIITVSIGARILNTVYGTYSNTSSFAATVAFEGEESLGDFADWFPILVITGVGAAVLGMLGFFNKG